MKKKLSLMLACILAFSMFVGCSSQTTEEDTSSSDASVSDTNLEDEVEADTEETEEDTVRTMTFYNGELELPESFDNFVVLDYSLVDNFVALGVAPTYGTSYTYAETHNYMYAQHMYGDFDLTSIEVLSTKSDTFFEELLVLAPDFIIINESSATDLENYEAIAPTYVMPTVTDVPEDSLAWKETFKLVGEFLGEEEKAEEMLVEYDELVAESKELIAEAIEGKTALVVQLNEVGFKIRTPDTQTAVYSDLGFEIPEGLTDDYATTGASSSDGSYSVETIIEFNPDYIFIHNQSTENYDALVGTPIWDNITAVADGNVYEIAQSAWNHTNGYNANTCRVNDLVYFVLENEQILPEYGTIE
ncbi:MAG: ABC transporter substrate-binding protein [Clostridia bacterium]